VFINSYPPGGGERVLPYGGSLAGHSWPNFRCRDSQDAPSRRRQFECSRCTTNRCTLPSRAAVELCR